MNLVQQANQSLSGEGTAGVIVSAWSMNENICLCISSHIRMSGARLSSRRLVCIGHVYGITAEGVHNGKKRVNRQGKGHQNTLVNRQIATSR